MFPCRDRFVLHFSFRGNVGRGASETSPCRRTGNAKRRARPPQSDGERPGRRRGNRDPRALLGWPGCLPRRLQLVFTRSSGRNSLCLVGSKRCGCHRGRTPSDSMFGSSVTGLGANPTVGGVRQVPQRDHEGSKPQKKVSTNAVVVGCPSSACSSPGRAEGSSWSLLEGVFFIGCSSYSGVTRAGTSWHRTPAACSIGDRPYGRSWLRGPTAPCVCRVFAPGVASRTSPADRCGASGTPLR